MKVRELAQQLQELARRGFGDDEVRMQIRLDDGDFDGVTDLVRKVDASVGRGVILSGDS